MDKLRPFSSPSATTIDGLSIETDEDALVLSGSIEIRRDAEGLERLDRILDVLGRAATALRSQDLPQEAPGRRPAGPTIANPFAP